MPFDVTAGALAALASVVVIDLVLAGDNAIVVALAASGLEPARRRRVIMAGIVIATALRIALSLFAVKLLAIIGLTLAGGILLLWVAWKLYRELHDEAPSAAAGAPPKSFGRALFQVVAADLSMSLDNALAVAGTARDHFIVLVIGLLLSVGLMALAASMVARLLARHRWLAWLGVAIVAAVALRLIYDGSAEIVERAFGESANWLL
ncbi:MAG TPA: YjbE family putative metal transport protein [Stellaceae bacterium]|nr:YjbE family putative metal transport protein [Stellaceae bacterium]